MYREAFDAIGNVHDYMTQAEVDELTRIVEDPNYQLSDTMRRYAIEQEDAIGLLHLAGESPTCRFVAENHGMGLDLLLPHLLDIRTASKALCLEARLAWELNDSERAARAFASGYRLAQSPARDGFVICPLVGASTFEMMNIHVHHALENGRFAKEGRDRILESLEFVNDQDPFGFVSSIKIELVRVPEWVRTLVEEHGETGAVLHLLNWACESCNYSLEDDNLEDDESLRFIASLVPEANEYLDHYNASLTRAFEQPDDTIALQMIDELNLETHYNKEIPGTMYRDEKWLARFMSPDAQLYHAALRKARQELTELRNTLRDDVNDGTNGE